MKTWTPNEDEYLLAHLNRMGAARMAKRLDCKRWEVITRAEFLSEKHKEPQSQSGGVVVEEATQDGLARKTLQVTDKQVIDALTPMQRSIVKTQAHYEALGRALSEFNEYTAQAVAEVELSELLKLLLTKPRKPDEHVHEKLARLLLQEFVVLPRNLIA